MPGDERIAIDVDGVAREFLLHCPPAKDADLPLVIMFHGTGGTAQWAADETGWSDLADDEGFAVVYPEGLPPNPNKPAKFLTNPPVWHDGSFGARCEAEQAADLRFLELMLDVLSDRRSIDVERIFVTGFSNGAGMTFTLATKMPNRITAIAPVAGHCWIEKPSLPRPMPTLYLVGSMDPLIPLLGGQVRTPWNDTVWKPSVEDTLKKWARANGIAEVPSRSLIVPDVVEDVYVNHSGETVLAALTIAGHGHHWPGGKCKLSKKIGGPCRSVIDGGRKIWSFFKGEVK